ncbi:hypothetical protein Drorol1_Dr00003818 [Drosera rotundifolia]
MAEAFVQIHVVPASFTTLRNGRLERTSSGRRSFIVMASLKQIRDCEREKKRRGEEVDGFSLRRRGRRGESSAMESSSVKREWRRFEGESGAVEERAARSDVNSWSRTHFPQAPAFSLPGKRVERKPKSEGLSVRSKCEFVLVRAVVAVSWIREVEFGLSVIVCWSGRSWNLSSKNETEGISRVRARSKLNDRETFELERQFWEASGVIVESLASCVDGTKLTVEIRVPAGC